MVNIMMFSFKNSITQLSSNKYVQVLKMFNLVQFKISEKVEAGLKNISIRKIGLYKL